MVVLQCGDIILTHQEDRLPTKLISIATGSLWSHSLIYLGNDKTIESISSGVKYSTLKEALYNSYYTTLRCPFLNDLQKKKIVEFAELYIGKDYDYSTPFVVFRRKFGGFSIPQRHQKAIICSSLVVEIYQQVGINLCWNTPIPLPSDLLKSPYLERVMDISFFN